MERNELEIRVSKRTRKGWNLIREELPIKQWHLYKESTHLREIQLYNVEYFKGIRVCTLIGCRVYSTKSNITWNLCFSVISKDWRGLGLNQLMFKVLQEEAYYNNVVYITSCARESNYASRRSLYLSGFKRKWWKMIFKKPRYKDGEVKYEYYKPVKLK